MTSEGIRKGARITICDADGVVFAEHRIERGPDARAVLVHLGHTDAVGPGWKAPESEVADDLMADLATAMRTYLSGPAGLESPE